MSEKEQNIVIRSEEINEILDSMPNWFLRCGISVVVIIIIVGIILSCFVKYPDVLKADITLTTQNPPVTLVARANGKLTHLLVSDKQFIKTGQTIGVIENTAEYKDVFLLWREAITLLEQLQKRDTLGDIVFEEGLKTGEITPFYLQVLKLLKDHNLLKKANPYDKQIKLLKKDLANYSALLDKYHRQLKISDEQLSLVESDFKRDKQLFDQKAIAAREFETQKIDYLAAQNSNEQVKINASSALIQINSIEKSILQLEIQDHLEQNKLKSELSQQLKILLSEISKWKQLYIIESPINGKISFFNLWSIHQNIELGDQLFAIIPHKKQQFIGKCVLPIANTGKLALGQRVNIKLENYPYSENGMLNGFVTNISEVPNKDNYAIDVALSGGLTTSFQKKLIYKEQMKGKADIITRNLSLMDRVFTNFREILGR